MAEPGISVQAYHTSGAQSFLTRIVIHATCPSLGFPQASVSGQSLATARYFSSATSGGSAHYVGDPGREDHCVRDVTIAWHAPPNANSIGIELCGESSYSRDQWLSPELRPILQWGANRTRELCARFGVPLVKLTPRDLLAGTHGICGHVDVANAFHQTDHSDPGPNFPWDVFMALVGGATPKPVPQADPILGLGASGDAVRELQRLLGFAAADIDGDFGGVTDRAVRDFQNRNGLGVDGVVGQATWYALRRLDVGGAIGDLFHSPGMQTILGAPVTDETGCPDGIGRFVHFTLNGSIYWTPTLGAHEIHGGIRAKWGTLGWEKFFGYPVTGETVCPDGIGRFNHFERGSIYWAPASGAHEVHGQIRDAWTLQGWEAGAWGYPTSDEYAVPNGRGQDFARATVRWNAATHVVALV